VSNTWVEKYQMPFSNGLREMGLDELGLGGERGREIYSQKQANSERAYPIKAGAYYKITVVMLEICTHTHKNIKMQIRPENVNEHSRKKKEKKPVPHYQYQSSQKIKIATKITNSVCYRMLCNINDALHITHT